MKNSIIFIFLVVPVLTFAQQKAEIGIMAGGSQYWGDLNPHKVINSPDFVVGGLYRYNIDKRHAVKFCVNYAKLSVVEDTRNVIADGSSYSLMDRAITNFAFMGEFNFLPLDSKSEDERNTTYVSAGIGYTLQEAMVNIPFGLGYRYYVTERIALGGEVTLNKTFKDNLDGKENNISTSDKNTLLNNNDWYTFAGISVTYKFFNARATCPVYD